jgi:hypothetical protein
MSHIEEKIEKVDNELRELEKAIDRKMHKLDILLSSPPISDLTPVSEKRLEEIREYLQKRNT